jgi:outer membrane receptor protein involved in Fe transport
VKSNIAREYRAYIAHWKPYWLKYKDLSIPQNTTQPRPQSAVSSVDWRTPTEIANTGDFTVNTDSVNEAIADAESAFFDNPYVFQGKRNVGDPLHSVNIRTRYDFASGWAKGLSIGAGTRMRWERVAGARSEYTFNPGSSYTDALNGRTLTTVTTVNAKDQNVYDAQIGYSRNLLKNKIKWSIQLNVNNLTDQRELIVNNLHPRTLTPLTYRYQDPRQFILTNTVSF